MTVAMEMERCDCVPSARYRWDADTGILAVGLMAAVNAALVAAGPMAVGSAAPLGGRESAPGRASGAVSVEGEDGSWITLDLIDGWIQGVQVAVWPELRHRPGLTPPLAAPARVGLSHPDVTGSVLSVEVSGVVVAEVDPASRNVHFRFGRLGVAATFAIASEVLVELDSRRCLSGLWLLGVPRHP